MNTSDQKANKKSKEVWIALVTVKPKPGNKFIERNCKGAFVNMLAWVDSKSKFHAEIKHALEDYHLKLVEIEDLEPLSTRLTKFSVDNNLTKLAGEVENTGKVRFGTFHYYENEE